MEAQKKKEAALKEAAKQAERDAVTSDAGKEYRTTNTLTRKFAKMRDGLIMLAPWSHVLIFLCCYSLMFLCFIALTILCAHFAMFLLQIKSGWSPCAHLVYGRWRAKQEAENWYHQRALWQIEKWQLGDEHREANLPAGSYLRGMALKSNEY